MPVDDRDLLDDLNDLLIDHESGGVPHLSADARQRVEEYVERVAVNPRNLDEHCQYLAERLPHGFRFAAPLSTDEMEVVLENGFRGLHDELFAMLVFNPVALYALYDAIDEQYPEYWRELIQEEAEAVLRAEGRNDHTAPAPYIDSDVHEYEPVMSDDMAEIEGRTGEGSRRWDFQVASEDCLWDAGDSSRAAGRVASVSVGWTIDGVLHVRFQGFLELRNDTIVHAVWRSTDGSIRVERKLIGESGVLQLAPSDCRPPVRRESLEIRHVWQPATGVGWDIRCRFELREG